MVDRESRPPAESTNGSPLPEGYGALEEPEGPSATPSAPDDDRASEGRTSTARPEGRGLLGRAVGARGTNGRASRRTSPPDPPSPPSAPAEAGASDNGSEIVAGGPWGGSAWADGLGADNPGSPAFPGRNSGFAPPDRAPGGGVGPGGSGYGVSPVPASVPSGARSSLSPSPSPTPIPFIANPTTQVAPPDLPRAQTEAPPVPAHRRTTQGRRAPAPVTAPTTSRTRPESLSEEETLAAESLQPGRRLGRQKVRLIRSTSSRRMIRRVDTWTVFKVSLIFYLLGLAVLIVAGVILWNVATTFGTISSLQKSIKSLFDLKTFVLRPRPLLEYFAAGGLVLAILGTIMNTVAALLYNLISDIAGGVQIVVVTEPD